MYFKAYYLDCLSHASYLIGDTETGDAAVIDPRRDIAEYLADADDAGLHIRYVIETHLHADFVSGHVELAAHTRATVLLGAGGGATFAHTPVRQDDSVALGSGVRLRFFQTPGHTPESVCVLATPRGDGNDEEPVRLFTGDTLFIGDVGRPDLAADRAGQTPAQMATHLFASLRDQILPLPDAVEVWPAHGAGSACGKHLSDERVSTLGKQKQENAPLRLAASGDEAGFVRYLTEGLDEAPGYFGHAVAANRAGAPPLAVVIARVRSLIPDSLERFLKRGGTVIDGRDAAAFGAAHVPGSVNIPLGGRFAPFAGLLLPPSDPIAVVVDAERHAEMITRLARIGYDRVEGFLEGGFGAWREADKPVGRVAQMSAYELRRRVTGEPSSGPPTDAPAILDVRTAAEWDSGHIAGTRNLPLAELAQRIGEVPDASPVVVLCGSGYRSAIAASLLKRAGRTNVANVPGGYAAYQAAGGVQ